VYLKKGEVYEVFWNLKAEIFSKKVNFGGRRKIVALLEVGFLIEVDDGEGVAALSEEIFLRVVDARKGKHVGAVAG